MLRHLFANVKFDDDTLIIEESFHNFNDINVKHEKWIWDGVKADSFIFLNSEVNSLNDNKLNEIVSVNFTNIDTSTFTIKIIKRFKYFNCNFKIV